MLLFVFILCIAGERFTLGVFCMPVMDQGPHVTHGWGQVVRLLHLYSAKPGLHLLISEDGQIHGSADQTLYSKSKSNPNPKHCSSSRLQILRFFTCEHLNCRPAGDPTCWPRTCCDQRSGNQTLSLHGERWQIVLNCKLFSKSYKSSLSVLLCLLGIN